MASYIKRVQRSLSIRVSSRVVAFATCLLLVALSITFYVSRRSIRREAIEKAALVLDGTIQHIDNTLHMAETASNNMLWNIEHHLDDPKMMEFYCKKILIENPNILSCAMAFEPNYYPEREDSLYIVYTYRCDTCRQGGIGLAYQYDTRDYTKQVWYARAQQQDQPCWIEPVIGNDNQLDDIISYSLPVHDSSGKLVGIFSTDLDLDWLSKTILSAKPFAHSYSTLMGKNGKYIIHPDTVRLYHQTVFEQGTKQEDASVARVIRLLMSGAEGYKPIVMDGQNYLVFYKPYKKAGWIAAIVCPEDDIFGTYNRMWYFMIPICVFSLLLLLLLCLYATKKELRPLQQLGNLTQMITQGEYGNLIRTSSRHDEIGHLQNSFRKMQQSLTAYIEEANNRSTILMESNEALHKAYQQTMEADRVKMAFMHNMSDQIVHPIERIKNNADYLRQHYNELSLDETNRLVESIREDSENISDQLNRMLEVALKGEVRPAVQEQPQDDKRP